MRLKQILGVAVMAGTMAISVDADAQYRPNDRRNIPQYDRNQNEIQRLVVHAERQSNQFRAHVERQWDNRNDGRRDRDWDNDWSRGRDNRDGRGGGWGSSQGGDRGYGQGRNDDYRQNDDRGWDRDNRYSRRLSPKAAVQKLDEALERLRNAVSRNRGGRYDRNDRNDRYDKDIRTGRNEMMEVIRAADNVDFYFGRSRSSNSSLDREWAHVKDDLEPLARYYGTRMFGRW